jgi:hypothetical protein
MALAAHEDADLEGALADWRSYRRKKRVADIHWVDALYQAYLTGIIGLVVVAAASSAVGDDVLTSHQVRRVLDEGPGWIGVLAAFVIALGLRSGSNGGPLALERSDVRHILLSPVDRTTALRGPALRQLRFAGFVSIIVGGIAGLLAEKRLPGNTYAWIAVGALVGLTTAGLLLGSALLASSLRLRRGLASLVGLALLASAVLDGIDQIPSSPTAPFGHLALWVLEFDPFGLIFPVVALLLVGAGLSVLGRISMEQAERRSTLVGQLRFAATLQDLRTVIVLRRQLAQELPRLRPWIRLRSNGTGRAPFFVRGLRGVLRWPAARVGRTLLLGALAGLALRGVWAGTTPLVVAAGLAMFVAGLDAVEPLAQEVDHPSRRDSSPIEAPAIHLAHVPVGVLVMVVTAGVGAGVAVIPGPGQLPGGVAGLAFVPLALGGLAGALVSVLGGQAKVEGAWSLAPPEAQGMRLLFRTAWPPGLAVIGALPTLVARNALDKGDSAVAGGQPVAVLVIVVFVLVAGWVRVRDDIAAWWKQTSEAATASQKERTQ